MRQIQPQMKNNTWCITLCQYLLTHLGQNVEKICEKPPFTATSWIIHFLEDVLNLSHHWGAVLALVHWSLFRQAHFNRPPTYLRFTSSVCSTSVVFYTRHLPFGLICPKDLFPEFLFRSDGTLWARSVLSCSFLREEAFPWETFQASQICSDFFSLPCRELYH